MEIDHSFKIKEIGEWDEMRLSEMRDKVAMFKADMFSTYESSKGREVLTAFAVLSREKKLEIFI